MLQITRANCRLGLRVLLSALFATLLLALSATSAYADASPEQWTPEGQEASGSSPESSPTAPEAPVGTGETAPGTGQVGGSGEAPAPAPTEVAPETPAGEAPAGESPPAETPPVETQSTPPGESTSEAPATPSETTEQPPAESTPGPEVTETQSIPPTSDKPEEQAQSKVTQAEEASALSGSTTHPPATIDASLSTTTPDAHSSTLEVPPSAPAPAQVAPIAAQVTEVSAERETAQAGTSQGRGVTVASKQAGRFSCELSALGGSSTDNCTAGWLTSSPVTVVPPATSAAVAAVSSLVVAPVGSTSPADSARSGFIASGPPLTPPPGPAPSGASGVAGVGSSGAGVSIFLTLAGLLLLGAPRAIRRLRFSFEPWLAGCFVLIPERPD
jgi:hypothetical protein